MISGRSAPEVNGALNGSAGHLFLRCLVDCEVSTLWNETCSVHQLDTSNKMQQLKYGEFYPTTGDCKYGVFEYSIKYGVFEWTFWQLNWMGWRLQSFVLNLGDGRKCSFSLIHLLLEACSLVYSMQLTHSQQEQTPEPLVLQVAAERHLFVHQSARSAL